MFYRVLETSYGPAVCPDDWRAEGAELAPVGGAIRACAKGTASVRWVRYPLGGGGDVALSLSFRCLHMAPGGEVAVRFHAQRGREDAGFRVAWRGAEAIASLRGRELARVCAAPCGAEQRVTLATLAESFRIVLDGVVAAEGRMPPPGTDNEGTLMLELRDADVEVTGLREEFIAHDVDIPAWTRQDLLYEETFGPASFDANWACNGERPSCGADAFEFRPMSVSVLRERFRGPIAVECGAKPSPAPTFAAGVTDAIFLWMLDRPEGDLPGYMRGLPDAELSRYTPLPLYWVDFGGTNNQTTRLRRNPGRRMIRQFTDRPRLLERDRTYAVTTVANGNAVEFWVDGAPWIRAWDPEPLVEGHVGFRAFVAGLRVDALKVWRVG